MIKIIAAVAYNGVIGNEGQLPWNDPEDLRFFRNTTIDHTVVMGRKTFESIGFPLVRRRNIVLSRDVTLKIEGVEVYPTIELAMLTRPDNEVIYVIGGGEIYKLAMPWADELIITWKKGEPKGDVFFPEVDGKDWRCIPIGKNRAKYIRKT